MKHRREWKNPYLGQRVTAKYRLRQRNQEEIWKGMEHLGKTWIYHEQQFTTLFEEEGDRQRNSLTDREIEGQTAPSQIQRNNAT